MKYSLRSLMIVVAVLPPLLAGTIGIALPIYDWLTTPPGTVHIYLNDFGEATAPYGEFNRDYWPASSVPAPNPPKS